MDNLTHALFGAALAHVTSAPDAETPQRRLFLVAGVFAANAPDLDLLYFGITPPPLGYLLHHRGHTHTLLGLLPLAGLLALAIVAIPAARRAARAHWRRLSLLLALGLLSHLPLDFGNSYGVHPFAPFDARWYYGDAVFILEPWLWLLLGVPLLLRRLRRATRGAIALGGAAAWILGVLALSAVAHARTAREIARDPSGQTLDVILSANPLQPLCWVVITVEKDETSGTFTLRRGMLSLRPEWVRPESCPLARLARPPALAGPGPTAAGHGFLWHDAIGQPLAPLRERAANDCWTRAWMQFGRAPVMREGRIFDLRFERGGDNFTAMAIPEDAAQRACPAYMTRWAMPRADLLAPR